MPRLPGHLRYDRNPARRIRTADDLHAILGLDEACWVATAAPLSSLLGDPGFLALLDRDDDGRIGARDVRKAIRTLLGALADTSGVRPGNTTLALAHLDSQTDHGSGLLETATRIRDRTGDPGRDSITLADVRAVRAEEAGRELAEAGLVRPRATPDARVRALIEAVLRTTGCTPHPGGGVAITEDQLDTFLEEGAAWLAWHDHGRRDGEAPSPLLPLGAHTQAAAALLEAVREPLERWFLLCDAVRLDPGLADSAARVGAHGVDWADRAAISAMLAAAPIAPPRPDGVLDLDGPLNPHWAATLQQLRTEVLRPLLGTPTPPLTHAGWAALDARFEPWRRWRANEPGSGGHPLAPEVLRDVLDDQREQWLLRELFAESRANAVVLESVREVERVVAFQAWLLPLVNSFVSMPDLYDASCRSMFERGRLVMDGRHFTLAVLVRDRALHARFSDASNIFVLYVEIADRDDEPLYEVAVPVTAGGRRGLQLDKRGVFYDRDGNELHARVVHLVDNPVGLGEALLAPFQRLGHSLTELVEDLAATREAALQEQAQLAALRLLDREAAEAAAATETAEAGAPAAPLVRRRGPIAVPGSVLAGGGVALAALGSSLAFISKVIEEMGLSTLLVGLATTAVGVLLPVGVVAVVKLSRRDLRAILEGSGWAINARMRLSPHQARTFTRIPRGGRAR